MELQLLAEAAQKERESRIRRSSLIALYEAEHNGKALSHALRDSSAAKLAPRHAS
jgi:hypothetical protein